MNRFRLLALAAVLAGLSLTSSASAQTISIVAGNGQAICLGCFGTLSSFFQPMSVKVTDVNGSPLAGQTVTWNTNLGQLAAGANTLTDNNGISTNTIFPSILSANNAFQSYVQYNVTASVSAATGVNFILTQGIPDPFNLLSPSLSVQARNVPVSDTLSGQVGTTSSTKIILGVVDEHGTPVPNVALFLANGNDGTTGPVANCVSSGPTAGVNTVLTDSTGVATCTPLFGGVPGHGQFSVWVGAGYPNGDPSQIPTSPTIYATLPIFINVTAGVAGSITAKSGSGQSVNPGQPLPAPLVAEVDGSSNQPLAGAVVNWKVSPAGAATFSASTNSDVNGLASNSITVLGGASGTVTVTASLASDSTKTATFTITVVPVVSVTGFQIVSGNSQTASVGTAFANPLVVQVTTSNGVASNLPVQFVVTSGSVVLSATTATTNATGQAQVNVTAGTVTGPASVVASVSSNSGIGSQTFSLTVVPQAPTITGNNFVNGADGQRNSLSPCSLGSLVVPVGSLGLQPVSPTFPGQPVPSSVQLTIANVGAPILNIANTAGNQQSILFQVPCEVAPATSVPVSLTVGGGSAASVNVTIQAASPGIFLTPMSDGVLRAVIVRPDGSFVTLSNPARAGETVVAMATGLGPTTPSVGTGSVPAPGGTATVTGNVIVGMAGGGVPLTYAKLSEDLPGVYVVAFQIPSDVTAGNDVTFSIGLIPTGSSTAIYSGTTKIPVR